MTHDIKQLSKQHLKALLDIRTDAVLATSRELQQLLDECDAIRKEIEGRLE